MLFVTPCKVYYNRMMGFELKNLGITFTKIVAKLFNDLLGNIMETYVDKKDNILVKSKEA